MVEMSAKKDELDLTAVSTIQLYLANEVLRGVVNEDSAVGV